MTDYPKTIAKRLTAGDHATQPGGVILREIRPGEFATHEFNREPMSSEPREFFWGHSFGSEDEAREDYEERVDKHLGYTAGGALIPEDEEADRISAERAGDPA